MQDYFPYCVLEYLVNLFMTSNIFTSHSLPLGAMLV